MPPVFSKFCTHTLPTFEKVYRWYEGLSSDSEPDQEETGNPAEKHYQTEEISICPNVIWTKKRPCLILSAHEPGP